MFKGVGFKQGRAACRYNDSFLPGSPVASFPAEGWEDPRPPVPSSVATREHVGLVYGPAVRALLVLFCWVFTSSAKQRSALLHEVSLLPSPPHFLPSPKHTEVQRVFNEPSWWESDASNVVTELAASEAGTVRRCHQVLESPKSSPWLWDSPGQAGNSG